MFVNKKVSSMKLNVARCSKLNLTASILGVFVVLSNVSFRRHVSLSEPHLVNCPDPSILPNVSSFRAQSGLKVLVTGAAGFIGSHVAKDCINLGLEVVALDDLSGGFQKNVPQEARFVVGDLKDASFVSDLLEKEKFVVIYHLAAYAAEGLSHFIRNYNYHNNLVATTNLITQAVRVGSVKKIIFTSSIAVYGSGRTPMTEDMEPLPEDPYGISKLACEYDLKAAHKMFGLDYVIFRPHNVYGPGQNMYDKYRNVVGIFLNQLQAGKNLTVFGDGEQTRKFSYISDVSFPIALSGIAPHVRNEIFNVGGDVATTVKALARVTSDAWGYTDAEVIYLDSRDEVAHAESDHKKLACFFPGLRKPVELREGMARTVQWAKEIGKYFEPVEFEAVELKKNLPPSWNSPNLKEVPAFQHHSGDNLVEKELSKEKLAVSEDKQQRSQGLKSKAHFTLTQVTDGFYWRQPKAHQDHKPQRTLLSIHTSHNAWNMCRMMLLSLASVTDKFDVILIDDKSDKYDQDAKAEEWGVQVLRWGDPEDGPKGNTHSWNLAWQYAIENKYENIIIANNDLLIPNGTISKLEAALDSGDWDWVNPIVSKRGSGYRLHTLPAVYGESVQNWTDHPLHYSRVAEVLGHADDSEEQEIVEAKGMNGYAMAFNIAKMKKFQYNSSAHLLLDPKFTNIGNEDDLRERMTSLGGRTGVHTRAFAFHFKGFTLFSQKEGDRDSTDGYPALDDAVYASV